MDKYMNEIVKLILEAEKETGNVIECVDVSYMKTLSAKTVFTSFDFKIKHKGGSVQQN